MSGNSRMPGPGGRFGLPTGPQPNRFSGPAVNNLLGITRPSNSGGFATRDGRLAPPGLVRSRSQTIIRVTTRPATGPGTRPWGSPVATPVRSWERGGVVPRAVTPPPARVSTPTVQPTLISRPLKASVSPPVTPQPVAPKVNNAPITVLPSRPSNAPAAPSAVTPKPVAPKVTNPPAPATPAAKPDPNPAASKSKFSLRNLATAGSAALGLAELGKGGSALIEVINKGKDTVEAIGTVKKLGGLQGALLEVAEEREHVVAVLTLLYTQLHDPAIATALAADEGGRGLKAKVNAADADVRKAVNAADAFLTKHDPRHLSLLDRAKLFINDDEIPDLKAKLEQSNRRLTDLVPLIALYVHKGQSSIPVLQKGDTFLHYAARENDVNGMRALLEGGFPVDVRNQDGETALHQASVLGRQEIVALLLAHGAKPDAVDNLGHRPIVAAVNAGQTHVAAVLAPGIRAAAA